MKTVKLDRKAMQFTDTGCFASVKEGEEDKPSFDCLAYSGGVIKNHFYWGDLAIDLEGMEFPKAIVPLLEDHDTEKKIGFATKLSTDNNQLRVIEATFLDTPESIAFRQNSKAGFPYEASIYARPSSVEEVEKDEEVEVNGYKFKGPGTIWRKSTFKEVSICTFGYDSNTHSAAMNECEEMTIEYKSTSNTNKNEKGKPMDRHQFKAEFPEEFAKLTEESTASLKLELQDVTTKLSTVTTELKEKETRILSLEKELTLRKEADLKAQSAVVFTEKFHASGLPDRFSAKIQKLVPYDGFITNDALDVEAFSAAIDAEMKDWSDESGSVLGLSTNKKTSTGDTPDNDTDTCVDRMFAYIK